MNESHLISFLANNSKDIKAPIIIPIIIIVSRIYDNTMMITTNVARFINCPFTKKRMSLIKVIHFIHLQVCHLVIVIVDPSPLNVLVCPINPICM